MGKRLLRCLALVFGVIAVSSLVCHVVKLLVVCLKLFIDMVHISVGLLFVCCNMQSLHSI